MLNSHCSQGVMFFKDDLFGIGHKNHSIVGGLSCAIDFLQILILAMQLIPALR